MPKLETRSQNIFTTNSINLFSHCTPRALPQDDYGILQGASPKGAWQSPFITYFEIASVISFPRNDIMTQSH